MDIFYNDSLTFNKLFAFDLSKNVITVGESQDEKAINESIENILLTSPGERLFNPNFGVGLNNFVFEQLTKESAYKMLDIIVANLKRWESRITIIEDDIVLRILKDSNTIIITIPYLINNTGEIGSFAKKITQ
jgi:phage baseplate assembly protein W